MLIETGEAGKCTWVRSASMISPSRGHDPRFVEQHLDCDPASTLGAFAGEHSCMVFCICVYF